MDPAQLCAVLQGCLSPEPSTRSAAEETLKQYEATNGHAVNLLRITAEEGVDMSVRQVASITFKNLVRRSWEPSERSTAPKMSEEDKALIRDNILESLIRSPHMIQVQLAEVFRNIVYSDYPEKCPTMLQGIYNGLVAQQDQRRVHGALTALRLLTRKYEFRSSEEEDRAVLMAIVNTTFPVLLQIFQALLASPVSSNEVAEYQKLVCKIFWSASYMTVPDILAQPEQFKGWMEALHAALIKPVPAEAAGHYDSPWWKAKKWVMHINYRLFNRYAEPKHNREPADKAFGSMFVSNCMMQFLDAHLQLMAQLAQPRQPGQPAPLSPRCTNILLQYLQHATGLAACYKQLKEHWDVMLISVAFPLMCFNDADQELWQEDPQEYVRRGYDMMTELYDPKTAAGNFAHTLCSKKKKHLEAFMGHLAQVLGSYQQAAAAGAVGDDLARKMDGALLAIGCMSDILKRKSPYKEQLSSMLASCVGPCFRAQQGYLRGKACWISGLYCDVEDIQSGPSFQLLLQQVMSAMQDPELPVRVDAVVSLRNFIDAVEDIEALKPVLPQLLQAVFSLMDQVDTEDLVFTIESIVEKFGEDIAPYALVMTQQLVAAFWRYSSSADADDDDNDDDMAGIAAFNCIRAMITVLESVSSLPQMFPQLEELLFPILQKNISTDGQEIFEEVLEMMSYLTYCGSVISDRMWSLWPQLHTCLTDWGIDYWENILPPLDNLISKDTGRFLGSTNPDYLASALQMVEHSLNGDYNDRDIVCAAKLVEVLLQYCRGAPRMDACLQPMLSLVLNRLARTTNRTLNDALICTVANALYYNATLTMQALTAMNATGPFFTKWFTCIFANKKSGKPKHFRRMHDKKVCILGLMSLAACPALPAELSAGLPQVTNGCMRLLIALKEQQDDAAKAAEESSEEDEDWEDDGDDAEEDEDAGKEEDDDAYIAKLEEEARKIIDARRGDRDDDDDSDDEFTDDEEVESPLDPIDPFIYFADGLGALHRDMPERYQVLMSQADAGVQAALQGMMAFAEQQRQEMAKALAEKAAAAAGGSS